MLRYSSLCFSALILFAFLTISHAAIDKFDLCQVRINGILREGKTFAGINNETIEPLLYHGSVRGMDEEFAKNNRANFTTIKTEGCKILCEDPIDWYWNSDVELTLGIVSNWILPIIALLAVLPYDSFHRRVEGAPWHRNKYIKTIGAIINWLGSPQTALTATLFNIDQLRKCRSAIKAHGSGTVSGDSGGTLKPIKKDAYWLLCCMGQFNLPHTDERFLKTLAYGLFMPLCDVTVGEAEQPNRTPIQIAAGKRATDWTKQLLQGMAFQLRMLRRRGVNPTFLSILLFFVAYAVSLVLAFADVGGRTTSHSLAFGVLISWLPLFVLLALVDRNPVSADRNRKLMARWMWNVNAVKEWHEQQVLPNPPDKPHWWTQAREDPVINAQPKPPKRRHWWSRRPRIPPTPSHCFDDYFGEFVGQGRQIGYNGLASAVMLSVYDSTGDRRLVQSANEIANDALGRLNGHRTGRWKRLAFISLFLVWAELGMAFLISFNVPTVGVGCRSGSYLVYGGLSTLPWFIHLVDPGYKRPGHWRLGLCHVLNLLSTLFLAFVCFAAFSGVLKNCTCRGGFSGYLDFENSEYYREHFDVAKWWKIGAIVGALPVIAILIISRWLLWTLKTMWQVSELTNPPGGEGDVEMHWLT